MHLTAFAVSTQLARLNWIDILVIAIYFAIAIVTLILSLALGTFGGLLGSLLTLFGAEHSLGGIPGYEVKDTTDESPERVALIQQVTWAYLRHALNIEDSSWPAAQQAWQEAPARSANSNPSEARASGLDSAAQGGLPLHVRQLLRVAHGVEPGDEAVVDAHREDGVDLIIHLQYQRRMAIDLHRPQRPGGGEPA